MTISRRGFVAGSLIAGAMLPGCSLRLPEVTPPETGPGNRYAAMLRQIEGEANGTLGVELINLATGRSLGINRDRRFGHASSFKFSLAAKVLQRHASGEDDADRLVTWSEADLLAYAPFTRERIGTGATLRELARATQVTSDNTAANLLLREIGGPPALTGFWRSIGDEVSRVDRWEPEMNIVPPSEYRDTTTPAAMARTVAKIVYGDVLPQAERSDLKGWMVETNTGLRRVRAGLPEGWVAGDKTGTSGLIGTDGNYIDIGFAEGPDGLPPIIFACYLRARQADDDMQTRAETALARVGEVIVRFARDKSGLID
ncbi:beta-lactamase [Erythrobacter sp. Dej080120_24]|uniref:class A beta-lactamase n=1 Tax=Erythrobacter sp. Dej080120_24 TaxID=3024837 RepID=UPI00291C8684|nr:beta-lactamase [Erythrobacter sp. Dej080120_24]